MEHVAQTIALQIEFQSAARIDKPGKPEMHGVQQLLRT